MNDKVKALLDEYLEKKLHLKAIDSNCKVEWLVDECPDCSNSTYELKVDDFCPGVKVNDSELLVYLLNKIERK